MLRIHAPFAARTHPLVTGLVLTARQLRQRHAVVFEDTPVRRNGATLRDMSGAIALSVDGGARLTAPSLVAAVLAVERSMGQRQLSDAALEQLSRWEARAEAVRDSFDELALAIAIQHYTGVMAANNALCLAMEGLDGAVAETPPQAPVEASEPAASSSSSLVGEAEAQALPLLPLLDFLTADARFPLAPYAHVSKMWGAPSAELKRARALIRTTAASFSQQQLGQPLIGDTNFTNILPSSYALIQRIQNGGEDPARKRMPTLEESAGRATGGFSSTAANTGGYTKAAPRIRRDV